MSNSIKGFCLQSNEKIYPNSGQSVLSNSAVVEMEMPPLKEGEILAKTLYTGICGSDNSATIGKANFGVGSW